MIDHRLGAHSIADAPKKLLGNQEKISYNIGEELTDHLRMAAAGNPVRLRPCANGTELR